MLTDVETGKVIGLASTINLAEVLVGAYKAGPSATKAVSLALSKLEAGGLTFIPVDKIVADKAAELRATYGLKLPDALVASTAVLQEVDGLVSRDREIYAPVRGLRVASPEELGYRLD